MITIPSLDNCTVFPLPEGKYLEFKQGFNSCSIEKIDATICGFLNNGGGYLIIGVEDETRNIIGIKTDKSLDKFILMLDSIYHDSRITKVDDKSISVDSIKCEKVNTANNKEILIVTITGEKNTTYITKKGIIWHRLSASNYKQSTSSKTYSDKEIQDIVNKRLAEQYDLLQQKFELEKKDIMNKTRSERDKLIAKFKFLEKDFQEILNGTKKIENNLEDYRHTLYQYILSQKAETEAELELEKKRQTTGLLSYLCCFIH